MSTVQKYLGILKLELEDAQADILALEAVYDQRHAKGEISDYVYKNNMTVFRQEMASIAEIVRELGISGANLAHTVDQAETVVRQRIDEAIRDFDFPQAVREICERKLQKVRQYTGD